MSKAIGMVEYKTTSAGVVAADSMVKTSEVSIIEAQTVCPGKYIVIITGDLSAVTSAVDNAKTMHGKHLINSFVLGNRMNPFSLQFMELQKSRMYQHWVSLSPMMHLRSSWQRMKLQKQQSLI